MTNQPAPFQKLSVTLLEEVDDLCVEFERAWQSGERPAISDFLRRASDVARTTLLQELLLLDIDYRTSRGEGPACHHYKEVFPDDVALIDTVFLQAARADTVRTAGEGRQAVNLLDGDQPGGERMGRYRVLECVGEGGFGKVYRARDDELQRDVALKVPHHDLARRLAAVNLFRKEAQALATLRHPAIVPVHDVHFDLGDPAACFVVAQFMEGGDLAAHADQRDISADRAARMISRIAEALHYAHVKGLVHRDVKLSNILLDTDGEVYIADFGLALNDQSASDDEPANGTGLAGTPATMSPEQARGQTHLVDGRTDVYGLGVALYELLTGQRPFVEEDIDALLEQVQHRAPVPPRQLAPSIPSALERICLKALAKQPEDRYQNAAEMAADLRRFTHRTSVRWKRSAILLAAAGLLAAASWMAFWKSDASRTEHRGVPVQVTPCSLAVLPFSTPNEGDEPSYLSLGMADTLISRLNSLSDVNVRPTDSVRAYLDAPLDPVVAGSALGVDAVVAGSIRQDADQMRVTVDLLRIPDGESLWGAVFNEPSPDLFAIQDEICAQVARALVAQLSAQDSERVRRRHTENRQAYEAYIKGRYYWNQRVTDGPEALRKAITEFRNAIAADPLYAMAYAGLAESHAVTNLYSRSIDEQAFPRARAAAKRALEIDDELSEAHATFAFVSFYHDWAGVRAEQEFRKAIELNPSYATAHQWYGELLYFSERFDEAIAQLRRASELDPLSSTIKALQGAPYLWRRDYARARREFLKAEEVNPNSAISLHGLAICHEHDLQFAQALKCYEQQGYIPGQGYCLAKMGDTARARQMLHQLQSMEPFRAPPYHIALIHLGLSELDQAMNWLEKAKQVRDENLVWLRVDPKVDPLRDNPRFHRMLRAVQWAK